MHFGARPPWPSLPLPGTTPHGPRRARLPNDKKGRREDAAMGLATHGLGPRRQRILEPKWLRSVPPPPGGGQGAKSGRGERSQQSPTNDFLTPSVRKPFGGALCDGPCWSRAFNVETGATRGRVPPSNIEGADRTRATRLPSLLFLFPRQTPRRSSQGVRKHLSDPARIGPVGWPKC